MFLVTADSVSIVGINSVSADSLMQALEMPQNILLMPSRSISDKLMALEEIDDVIIQKKFPNVVEVHVYEKQLSGYVPYLHNYLCVDHECRVRDVTSEAIGLPVIHGLKFDSFRLGEALTVNDTEAFDTVVYILKLFSKYGVDYVDSIDAADPQNIRLSAYNVSVEFGPIKDADEKLRSLDEILDKLPDVASVAGMLDISDIKRHYIFKVLT
jgi:cell division septal protein FtsQ